MKIDDPCMTCQARTQMHVFERIEFVQGFIHASNHPRKLFVNCNFRRCAMQRYSGAFFAESFYLGRFYYRRAQLKLRPVIGQSYGCEWRSKDLSVRLSWAKRRCAPIAGRNFAARILGKELNSVSEIWSMSPWSMLHYIHLAKITKPSSTSNTVITLTNWQKESLHPTIILRFCPDRH